MACFWGGAAGMAMSVLYFLSARDRDTRDPDSKDTDTRDPT